MATSIRTSTKLKYLILIGQCQSDCNPNRRQIYGHLYVCLDLWLLSTLSTERISLPYRRPTQLPFRPTDRSRFS